MDNQQAIRIGWLAGVIDGEGCFVIARQKTKHGFKLRPHFCLRSTCQLMLERIANILSQNEVACHVYAVKPRKVYYKPQGSIQIAGFLRVKKLLDLISPFLVTKQAECLLLKEWIDYRFSLGSKPQQRKLSDKDWQYRQLLSDMKYNPVRPRDYTPSTQSSEDIVRPSGKPEEAGSRLPA